MRQHLEFALDLAALCAELHQHPLYTLESMASRLDLRAPVTATAGLSGRAPVAVTHSIIGYVSQATHSITPGSWVGWSRAMWPFTQPDKKVMALRPTPPYRPAQERAPCSFSRRDSTGL